MTVTLAPVHDDTGIEDAIALLAVEPGGGLICLPDSFNTTHREVIIAAAPRPSLPLIGTIEFPKAGGLMSYWFDTVERLVEAASYTTEFSRAPIRPNYLFSSQRNLR